MGKVIGIVCWLLMFVVMGITGTGWGLVGVAILPSTGTLAGPLHILWIAAGMFVVLAVMAGIMTFADRTYNYRWYKRRLVR